MRCVFYLILIQRGVYENIDIKASCKMEVLWNGYERQINSIRTSCTKRTGNSLNGFGILNLSTHRRKYMTFWLCFHFKHQQRKTQANCNEMIIRTLMKSLCVLSRCRCSNFSYQNEIKFSVRYNNNNNYVLFHFFESSYQALLLSRRSRITGRGREWIHAALKLGNHNNKTCR